jgi:carbonic anhydrase
MTAADRVTKSPAVETLDGQANRPGAPALHAETATETATEELLRRASGFAARRAADGRTEALPAPPALRVAVLACMDARLDVTALLGLSEGAAHVIRNAGGVVTDDAVRSLAISQHELGTREIVLIQHTGCGMQAITDDGFRDRLERATGDRPSWPVLAFSDLEDNLRSSVAALAASPYLRQSTSIRGFVYDIATGALREVAAASPASCEPAHQLA